MAQLLGVSIAAVHTYEQGSRTIPPAVERHLYFLVMCANHSETLPPCWEIRNCQVDRRAQCPAWQLNSGGLCWFINGTLCDGSDQGSWEAKMGICRRCPVFTLRIVI